MDTVAPRATLIDYADTLGVSVADVTLSSGQRHDVVVNAMGQVVWRFPRTAPALEALPTSAARASAARALGLPSPGCRELVNGPRGFAHMAQPLVAGVGLSAVVADALPEHGREQLTADLAELLRGLRSCQPSEWPGTAEGWTERWAALSDRIRAQVIPLIDSEAGRIKAAAHLAGAVTAAQSIGERGLVHGDLGGENVHVHPNTGAILGVIDWDDAAPGDASLDFAAVAAHAPPWLRRALIAEDPDLQSLWVRAEAYLGTFALQEALWGVEAGDAGAVAAGLAPYS